MLDIQTFALIWQEFKFGYELKFTVHGKYTECRKKRLKNQIIRYILHFKLTFKHMFLYNSLI